jgi:putative FmdB family regulatory protein
MGACARLHVMPLYDFSCQVCGTQFEATAPLGQLVPCEKCGSVEVERLLSRRAGAAGTVAPRAAAEVRRLRTSTL